MVVKLERKIEFWTKSFKFLIGTSLGAVGISSVWGILGLERGVTLSVLLGFFLVAGAVELYFNLRRPN